MRITIILRIHNTKWRRRCKQIDRISKNFEKYSELVLTKIFSWMEFDLIEQRLVDMLHFNIVVGGKSEQPLVEWGHTFVWEILIGFNWCAFSEKLVLKINWAVELIGRKFSRCLHSFRNIFIQLFTFTFSFIIVWLYNDFIYVNIF